MNIYVGASAAALPVRSGNRSGVYDAQPASKPPGVERLANAKAAAAALRLQLPLLCWSRGVFLVHSTSCMLSDKLTNLVNCGKCCSFGRTHSLYLRLCATFITFYSMSCM
ncbi:uncharacterized protein LOC129237151 [Anastrepha obliqua]|uniref:uncharacterized protein LOC129237151 n=1 Tax=Anastrepha obliqua TaxID=95512 RepID=UPI0024090266|nr:uncharacterized protein LOC129237151 [Anastrepha obliqua]